MKITDSTITRGLHHRDVALVDRVEDEPPDAGPAEHRLDHDDAAEQEAEFEPDHGDDRQPGVAQRVVHDDGAFADAPWTRAVRT